MKKLLPIILVSLLGLSLTSCKVKKMEPIDYALSQFGVGENGEGWTNPEILKYMDEVGFDNQDQVISKDLFGKETIDMFHVTADSGAHRKWCAPFVEWCLKKAGYSVGHSMSGIELALSMEPVTYSEAKRGDVVILRGHIAFLWDKKNIKDGLGNDIFVILGGDQTMLDKETRVSFLPISTKDLLGVYRPVKDPRGKQNMKHIELKSPN